MKYNYILKVWFAAILAAPFIIAISTLIILGHTDSGAFEFILLEILMGYIFSLPTLAGCMLFIFFAGQRITSLLSWKLILISLSVIGELITIFLLFGRSSYILNQNYGALTFSVTYTLCIIIFGILFKLKSN